MTQRLFLTFSELQLWEDGVSATSRHLHSIDVAVRESTRLVWEPRRCRSTQVVALADVLLHPSRSEGFGMLVLEAQHVGVPVITTRRGAMKDYTMHGAIPASRRVEAPSTRVVSRNDGSGWFIF